MDNLLKQLQSAKAEQRREAIVALERTADPRALPALSRVYHNDPDPALRELALRAGHFIQQQANRRPAGNASAPPPEASAPGEDRSTVPLRPISAADERRASHHVSRAMDAHVSGDDASALKELRRALEANPALSQDQAFASLASSVTSLPVAQALAALQDKKRAIQPARASRPHRARSTRQTLTLLALIVALGALAVLGFWFVRSGSFDRWRLALSIEGWKDSARTIAGTQVYVIAPEGEPPAAGWPLLVAFHGYGGAGDSMLALAARTQPEGILLVAPTFGGYEPYPGNGPLGPLTDILAEVRASYPVNPGAVVLYGFSQGGTFAYRYSIYHPYDLAGVVTAGAPDFDAGDPTRYDLPYVLTWGEDDGLYGLNEPYVTDLQARGFAVDYAAVRDAGHEITGYSVDRALDLIRAATGG